jgi:hypothetical protein
MTSLTPSAIYARFAPEAFDGVWRNHGAGYWTNSGAPGLDPGQHVRIWPNPQTGRWDLFAADGTEGRAVADIPSALLDEVLALAPVFTSSGALSNVDIVRLNIAQGRRQTRLALALSGSEMPRQLIAA